MLELIGPDGILAHLTACYRYLYEVPPFHLHFFCGDSIDRLAAQYGFACTGRFVSGTAEGDPIHQYYECRVFKRAAG